jgi:hypothetical protein
VPVPEDGRSSACGRCAYLGNDLKIISEQAALNPASIQPRPQYFWQYSGCNRKEYVIPLPGPRHDPKDHERAEETNRMRQALKSVWHPPAAAVKEALQS